MSDDKIKEINNQDSSIDQAAPEMLGVELAKQLASDGTPIISATEIPAPTTFFPPAQEETTNHIKEDVSVEEKSQVQTPVEEIIVPDNEPKVPPKEFDLEAQRGIVDEITDTYIPHPVGNSE